VQDTKRFWQKHEKARHNLDKKLASLPFSEKLVIMQRMEANHKTMQNAKPVK
jgi:hypothetical protein